MRTNTGGKRGLCIENRETHCFLRASAQMLHTGPIPDWRKLMSVAIRAVARQLFVSAPVMELGFFVLMILALSASG
ncbi:hypothetical protein KTJ87_10980 [Rhodobacteraceae bacterium ASV31]|nr:hypothetical protein [Anianabacter salinae]